MRHRHLEQPFFSLSAGVRGRSRRSNVQLVAVEQRITAAWRYFARMKRVLGSRMRRRHRIMEARAVVEACLLYGSETWVLTRQLEKRLRAFQGSVLRVVLGRKPKRTTAPNGSDADTSKHVDRGAR